MSISMIDRVRFAADPTHRGGLQMTVSGPLHLDPNSSYASPITIKFVIIQGPPRTPGRDDGHVPSDDNRVRGVENVRAGEARGVAVAVMEKDTEYAYETLTWCDFMRLPDLVDGARSELTVSANPRGQAVRRWEVYPPGATSGEPSA